MIILLLNNIYFIYNYKKLKYKLKKLKYKLKKI